MEEEGYERDYGAALTIAASTVGPIFPPSIPLVLYATIAQISSVKSLLGGVGPGILMSAMLLFYVLLVDKKKLVNPPMAKAMMKEERSIRELFFRALPIAIAPLLILITMLSGIFSPGETGGMAVLYMLLLGICHRSLTWSGFWRCVKETCKSVSSIMVIMTAGGIFTKALMLENLPAKIIALLGPVANIPLAVILIVNIILLIMGMFMESNCALILTAPIVLQITQGFGMDPVYIGVMMVMNLMIGLSTPPFGLCIYAVSRVANVPSEKVIKSVVPMYIPLGIALILTSLIPAVSTFVPNTIMSLLAGG